MSRLYAQSVIDRVVVLDHPFVRLEFSDMRAREKMRVALWAVIRKNKLAYDKDARMGRLPKGAPLRSPFDNVLVEAEGLSLTVRIDDGKAPPGMIREIDIPAPIS